MMLFLIVPHIILSLVSLAAAIEFEAPPGGYEFIIGEPTTLTWEPVSSNGTVTLELIWGATISSDEGETLESHLPDSGTYTWTPSQDLSDLHDYTICLYPDQPPQDFDCLPRFSISGAENTTSPTVTATSNPTADAEPTPDPSDDDDAPDEGDGLSTAAKAGIGGGMGVVVVAVVVVGVCLVKRGKRKATTSADPSIALTSHPNPKTEWAISEIPVRMSTQSENRYANELPGRSVYEMHSNSVNELSGGGLREMDGGVAPVELPTIEHKFV
ncbi:hypothetical protein BDV12DRAFT_15302 [Aspergillus spectabilis]